MKPTDQHTKAFREALRLFMQRHHKGNVRDLDVDHCARRVAEAMEREILLDARDGLVRAEAKALRDVGAEMALSGYAAADDWPHPGGGNVTDGYLTECTAFWEAVHAHVDAWIKAGNLAKEAAQCH